MAWLTLLAAVGLALTTPAMSMAGSAHFNIAPQPLPQALKAFAAQAHMQLLYEYGAVARAKGNAVVGDLDTHAALEQLLKNSGLEVVYSSDDSATIRRVSRTTAAPQSQTTDQTQDSQPGGRPLLVQPPAGQTGPTSEGSKAVSADKSEVTVQEIVVTAQKRAERLQDVPVPVAVIPASTLLDSGLEQMKDFYSKIPGLELGATANGGFWNGGSTVAIRGINTGAGDPTVSFVIDDVPFGTSNLLVGVLPDIDPGDLDHIEILRGPQGTLYGADSMGGLIKYVTVDPSTDGVSGRVQGGFTGVYNGAEVGYQGRASINVPLNSTLAIRMSGFARLDPGYIDDPTLSTTGVNKTEAAGGRLSALWEPSEVFSLNLSALFQHSHTFGSPETDVQTGLAGLQQDRIRGTGFFETNVAVYSAKAKAKLGDADLTSVTAINSDSHHGYIDFSYAVPTWTVPFSSGAHTITEDLRLSVPLGRRVDWLVGAYYDYESNLYSELVQTSDKLSGATTGFIEFIYQPATYTEYAAYTDFTFHLTDRFDIQLGGRASNLRQNNGQTVFLASGPMVSPDLHNSAHPFTYLVTPSFKVSSDLMVYARAASGYRPGGQNNGLANAGPASYDADYTKNYEVGVKGSFFEHVLFVDLSAYHIDWRNIQLEFIAPNQFAYLGNGSAAKSEGVEVSVETRPLRGMSITGWVAYDNAVITQPSPVGASVILVPGDRLPLTSRFSASVAATQEFPLPAGWIGTTGGDVTYVGNRASAIGTYAPADIYPAYTRLDLHAAAKYQGLELNLYLNNVTDKRGIVGGGPGTVNPAAFYYIQPRTIGLNVSKTF